jgi:hypothetical protein
MTKLPNTIGGKIPAKEHNRLLIEDAAEQAIETILFARHNAMRGVERNPQHMFAPRSMGPMWLWTKPGLQLETDEDSIFAGLIAA